MYLKEIEAGARCAIAMCDEDRPLNTEAQRHGESLKFSPQRRRGRRVTRNSLAFPLCRCVSVLRGLPGSRPASAEIVGGYAEENYPIQQYLARKFVKMGP